MKLVNFLNILYKPGFIYYIQLFNFVPSLNLSLFFSRNILDLGDKMLNYLLLLSRATKYLPSLEFFLHFYLNQVIYSQKCLLCRIESKIALVIFSHLICFSKTGRQSSLCRHKDFEFF